MSTIQDVKYAVGKDEPDEIAPFILPAIQLFTNDGRVINVTRWEPVVDMDDVVSVKVTGLIGKIE